MDQETIEKENAELFGILKAFEAYMANQEATYPVHIERLQAVSRLGKAVSELKVLKLDALAVSEADGPPKV